MSITKNYCNSLLDLGSGMSVNACTFLGFRLTAFWEIISPKKAVLVHLKWHLSLLSLKFACLDIRSTLSNVASWYLSTSLKPLSRILSVIPHSLDIPLMILSIFFWNMSPASATSNSNHMCMCLPNGQNMLLNMMTVYLILGYDILI